MDSLTHRSVSANGINLHFVELGSGPPVLFLHGFPEGWYSWRNQLPVFAEAGYRAIAPDLRGYGDSSAPSGADKYSYLHIVGDLIGLLDALQLEKVALVAHDWGAAIGLQLCLFRPDRVIAYAALSAPLTPRNPARSILQSLRSTFGENHYILKFQVPGGMEEKIARMSPEVFFRYIFGGRLKQDMSFLESSVENISLPEWMSEEDLKLYVSEFQKNGFTPPLNYYRALDLSWELTAPWTSSKVIVPTIFLIGNQDLVFDYPGFAEFIKTRMAEFFIFLEEAIVLEGARHFIQLERPVEVNNRILCFLKAFRHHKGKWIERINKL